MNRFSAVVMFFAVLALPAFVNADCGCGCDGPAVIAVDSGCGCDAVQDSCCNTGCNSCCDTGCGCQSSCDCCNSCNSGCNDCCTRTRLRLKIVCKDVCRSKRVCTTDRCGCSRLSKVCVRKRVPRLRLEREEVPTCRRSFGRCGCR